MKKLVKLSALEMRQGLVTKEFSAKELTTAHLDRIKETNPRLNSFLLVAEKEALIQAEAADKELSEKGDKTPLLTGIPIAIKDQISTKGIKTTCASKILANYVPPYDATTIKRLKKDGAVLIGKTNQDEFAMGSSSENSAFGVVRNPWNEECVPGGSSSGSAVAVACGQAPLSLGTDTGGSIRQPAGFNGIVGLKPTYGRVSRYGAVAFASSLDQIGPMARTVDDIAIILNSIAGFDENDSTSMKVEVPNYLEELKKFKGQSLKGLRVGVPKEYFVDGMDKEVEEKVRASIATLEKLGADIVEISLPNTKHALATYYIIAPAEASSNLARYDGIRYGVRAKNAKTLTEVYEKTRGEGFGDEVKRRILIGNYVLSAGYYDAYYKKAQQVRTLIINDFKSAFANQCDIIAGPVSPSTAFKIGENTDSPLSMYLADIFTLPASLAGVAGMSVPCALDSNSLPIGLQLFAAPFEEMSLMRVADAFMSETKFKINPIEEI